MGDRRAVSTWLFLAMAAAGTVFPYENAAPQEPKVEAVQVAQGGPPPGVVRGGGGPGRTHRDDVPPEITEYKLSIPAPKRIVYVSSGAREEGDGSRAKPWMNLAAALTQLIPGDRLVMLPGRYRGPLVIGETCKDGTSEAPIQVFAEVDGVLHGRKAEPALEVRRAHWVFEGFEIIPGDGGGAGFATYGPGAHDITLHKSHLHNGFGDGVFIGPHSQRVTVANSHIHQFGPRGGGKKKAKRNGAGGVGVRIAPGTREISVISNQIHHNRGEHVDVMTPQAMPKDREGKTLLPAEQIKVDGNVSSEFAADDK